MKQKLFNIILIIIFTLFLLTPKESNALTMNAYGMSNSNFNVWGQGVQTTFADQGYHTELSVDGQETSVKNLSGSLNGVTCNTNLSYISNGNYVKVTFTVHNSSTTKKTIGIATHTDIQIASNDYAPITNLSGNRGFTMSDGSNYTFTFLGRNSYGVTDVDAYWFGNYQYHKEKRWENSQTYYYGNASRAGDSGMAFSWKNRSIDPGETQKYSVVIGVGTLNTPPTIRVTSEMKNEYFPNEEVPVRGYVNDIDIGDIVTVKYAVDGGKEITISSNLRPNKVEKYFSTSFQIPIDLPSGEHFFQVWAADDKGNMSAPVTVYFHVTQDTKPPTATHTIDPDTWTKGQVKITLTATDDITGVKQIGVPNGAYVDSNVVICMVNQNGDYNFTLEDKVGNKANYTVTITNIDKEPPVAQISHTPEDWTIDYVKIKWKFTDEQSGMDHIILPDGTTTNSADGEYTVTENGNYTFKAYDKVGNETIVTETINNIDKIKPEGVLSLNQTELTDKPVEILWEAVDNESGFKKIILPDASISYEPTGSYYISKMGTYTFIIYDKVGNEREISIEVNNVDMEKPSLIITQEVTRWTNEDIDLHWKAKDNQSGLKEVVLPNSKRTKKEEGDHKVTRNGIYTFLAYDKIGNGIMVKHEVTNIDKTGPFLKLKSEPADNGNINIIWEASDSQSGLRNIILPDGKSTTETTGTFLTKQNGVYSFIAYDKLGNSTVMELNVNNIDKEGVIFILWQEKINETQYKINWKVMKGTEDFKQILLPDNTYSTQKERILHSRKRRNIYSISL